MSLVPVRAYTGRPMTRRLLAFAVVFVVIREEIKEEEFLKGANQ